MERNWKEALTKTVYVASIYRGMQGFKTRLAQKFKASDGELNEKSDWRFDIHFSVYGICAHTVWTVPLILLQQNILQCCLQVNHLRVIAVLQFITHWPLCVPVQLTFVKGQCFAAKCHRWIFSRLFLVEHEQSFHLITPLLFDKTSLWTNSRWLRVPRELSRC